MATITFYGKTPDQALKKYERWYKNHKETKHESKGVTTAYCITINTKTND